MDWWLWLGMNVLPSLSLVYIGLLLNSNPAKAIPKEVHQGLLIGTLCYLLLISATLLGQGWAVQGELSLNDYRRQSYAWLLPFQLILMVSYFLEFVRKESLFRPNAQVIMEIAKENSAKWSKKQDRFRQACFDFIMKGNISSAIDELQQIGGLDPDHVVMLQSQHSTLMQSVNENTVDPAEAQRQLNRITLAVMNLMDK